MFLTFSETDRLYSDEFPKQFEIKGTPLAKGGFGSVHLVIDMNRKDEEKFVAMKIVQVQNDLSEWRVSKQDIV